jgi:hypothetical protein
MGDFCALSSLRFGRAASSCGAACAWTRHVGAPASDALRPAIPIDRKPCFLSIRKQE